MRESDNGKAHRRSDPSGAFRSPHPARSVIASPAALRLAGGFLFPVMKIISGLQKGQVLQRQGKRGATALLTGRADIAAPVFATLEKGKTALPGWTRRRVGTAKDGRFSATLKGIPAGGPYRLRLASGGAHAGIASFYVGDVWLLAGQSNMEGCGKMGPGVAGPHPLIRAFSMRREWRQAADPLHVLRESPDTCHNDGSQFTPALAEHHRRTALRGVGAGLFFAHEMLARSGVPQGLVCTAHGGTSMEQWNPAHKKLGGGSQYGSFLLSARATGQPFAGVLWYQGESDATAGLAAIYTDRMKKLVAASRRDLRQPGLPWIIVQIGRVFGLLPREGWNSIQEQQRLLPAKIKHLETVAAIDLALDDPIHISTTAFPRLAQRLARAADRLACGNRSEAPAPRLRSISPITTEKGTGLGLIDVAFDHVAGGLRSAGEPHGFSLVGADGQPLPLIFKTTLHGDTVRLHLPAGVQSGEVRLGYGVGLAPTCTITDARDLALPVFAPVTFGRPEALLPFMTRWLKTPVISKPAVPLKRLSCPDVADHPGATEASYGENGFVDEHLLWQSQAGHAYFSARISLPEAMKLGVLAGYDGPFRLWIDGAPFFDALDGINPCFPDEGRKTARLAKGDHELTVAMDLNGGAAWGFFLRFVRCDVTRKQIETGNYARPVYGV